MDIRSSPPISSCARGINTSAPGSPQKAVGLGFEGREGFATPILARQRLGLLNPPFLGDERERDLTSSVKGRAADGLLSLMRMAN